MKGGESSFHVISSFVFYFFVIVLEMSFREQDARVHGETLEDEREMSWMFLEGFLLSDTSALVEDMKRHLL